MKPTQDVSSNNERDPNNSLVELPMDSNTLSELQQKDMFCANILAQIEKGNIIEGQLYHPEQTVEKICDRW